MSKQKATQAKLEAFLKRIEALTYEQFLSEVAQCLLKEHSRLQLAALPKFFGRAIDLRLLFSLVVANGGYHEVCSTDSWDLVVERMSFPTSLTHAEHQLRIIYLTYLLPYQERHTETLGISAVPEVEFMLGDADEYSNLSAVSGATNNNTKRTFAEIVNSEAFRPGFSHIQSWSSVDNMRLRQSIDVGADDTASAVLGKSVLPIALSVDVKSFTECQHICLSLLSGLPNEVDYAFNTLLLISQSSPESIRFAWCGPLLDILLASIGIVNPNSSISEHLQKDWRQQTTKRYAQFWRFSAHRTEAELFLNPSVFTDNSVLLLPPVSECADEEMGEDIFSSLQTDHLIVQEGSQSTVELLTKESLRQEYQHVYTVATIINNVTIPLVNPTTMSYELWSTHARQSAARSNIATISQSITAMRFLLLLAHCKYSTLRKLGLELLCNVNSPMMDADLLLTGGQCTMLAHLSMRLLCTLLMHGDRYCRIRGLEMVSALVSVGENFRAFSDPDLFPNSALQALLDCLLMEDVRLLLTALDALLALTNTVMDIALRFANLSQVVELLISFLTKSESKFSHKACKGIRITSMQLPVPVTSVRPVHLGRIASTPAHLEQQYLRQQQLTDPTTLQGRPTVNGRLASNNTLPPAPPQQTATPRRASMQASTPSFSQYAPIAPRPTSGQVPLRPRPSPVNHSVDGGVSNANPHLPMLTRVPHPVPLHQVQAISPMQPIRRQENQSSVQECTPPESTVTSSATICPPTAAVHQQHIPVASSPLSTNSNSSELKVPPPSIPSSALSHEVNGSTATNATDVKNSSCSSSTSSSSRENNIPMDLVAQSSVLSNGDCTSHMNGTVVTHTITDTNEMHPPSSPPSSKLVKPHSAVNSPPSSFHCKDRQVMPPPLSPAARLPQLRHFAHEWLRENYEVKSPESHNSTDNTNGPLISRRYLQFQLHAAFNQGRIHMGGPHVSELAPPSTKMVNTFVMELFPSVERKMCEIDGQNDVVYVGLKPKPGAGSKIVPSLKKDVVSASTVAALKHKLEADQALEENVEKRLCLSVMPVKPLNGVRSMQHCHNNNGILLSDEKVEKVKWNGTGEIRDANNGLPPAPAGEEDVVVVVVENGVVNASEENGVKGKQNGTSVEDIAVVENVHEEDDAVNSKECNGENEDVGSQSEEEEEEEEEDEEDEKSESMNDTTLPMEMETATPAVVVEQLPYPCRWSSCEACHYNTLAELSNHLYHTHICQLMEQRQWSACPWRRSSTVSQHGSGVLQPQQSCEVVRGPLSLYQHVLTCHASIEPSQSQSAGGGEAEAASVQPATIVVPSPIPPSSKHSPMPPPMAPQLPAHILMAVGHEEGPEYPLTKHIRLTAALCLRNLSDQMVFASEFLKHEAFLVDLACSSQDCSKVIAECLQRAWKCRRRLDHCCNVSNATS